MLDNATHRQAGANDPAVDVLNDANRRALLVKFLKNIDAGIGFFNPTR